MYHIIRNNNVAVIDGHNKNAVTMKIIYCAEKYTYCCAGLNPFAYNIFEEVRFWIGKAR
jgi:hypothetical protein